MKLIKKIFLTIATAFTLLLTCSFVQTVQSHDHIQYQTIRKESQRRYSAQGTAVPNSGEVENVYLNTSLSVEEVVNLASQLIYYEDAFYVVVINSDSSLLLSIFKNEGYQILYTQNGTNEYLFTSNQFVDGDDLGFLGWNPNFTGIIELNFEVVSNNETFGDIGTQNESLTNLFSITPFEEETPSFTETFLEDSANIVTDFIAILVSAVAGIGDILYDSTTSQLTIVGSALAFALAVGVVYLLFRMVRGLIKSNNRG